MFTDSTATPTRMEVLVDLLRQFRDCKTTVKTIRELLQPSGLPGFSGNYQQSKDIVSAARELGLIHDEAVGHIQLRDIAGNRPARVVLLETIDHKVLTGESDELWFALFYSYLLGRNEVASVGDGDRWERDFNNDLFGDEEVKNRFNRTKYTGLRRWYRYSGLGWHDSSDTLVPNPYHRLKRALPKIFDDASILEIGKFMTQLAAVCPELDGGTVFKRSNSTFDAKLRRCTAGLSHALVDLHDDGVLELNCPADTDGWSIAAASPPRDGKMLRTDRVASVSLCSAEKRGKQ
jgi:hypothetical protein